MEIMNIPNVWTRGRARGRTKAEIKVVSLGMVQNRATRPTTIPLPHALKMPHAEVTRPSTPPEKHRTTLLYSQVVRPPTTSDSQRSTAPDSQGTRPYPRLDSQVIRRVPVPHVVRTSATPDVEQFSSRQKPLATTSLFKSSDNIKKQRQNEQTSGRDMLKNEFKKLSAARKSARKNPLKALVADAIHTKPYELDKKGQCGSKIWLCANYFELKSVTTFRLYQYRVSFAPEEDLTATRKKLLRLHKQKLGSYIFDGTTLYTANALRESVMELISIRDHDQEPVMLKLNHVGNLEHGDQQFLQFFNILVRDCLQGLSLKLIGRNYFDSKCKIQIDEFRLELWPGYITSIRQHENSILMCTEITHKLMRTETVLDILTSIANSSRQNYRDEFKKAIIGNVVLTDYANKTYRIDDVDFTQTPSCTFHTEAGVVTYEQYYREKYRIRITDMRQPLLVSRPKLREQRRGSTNLIFLVPELCRTTGMTENMRSNFTLMKALADHTRLTPKSRVLRLNAFQQRLLSNKPVIEELMRYDLVINDSLLRVPARVLPQEKIAVFNSYVLPSRQNDWTQEIRGKQLLSAPHLNSWAIIHMSSNQRELQDFITVFTKMATNINFKISQPIQKQLTEETTTAFINTLDRISSYYAMQLIMIILPRRRTDLYSAIKKRCCIDRGVATQVVLAKNLRSPNMSAIASKIAIQVCCKIGGAPWAVDMPMKDAMIVGFDVCHDTTSKGVSIGALVASLDRHMSRYYSAVSYQLTGEELSNELGINILKALCKYQSFNKGELPGKIVVYRDGVGDGQIPFVKMHELERLLEKLRTVYNNRPLKLAFIIVTKRINTRLIYEDSNPPPGTVVDDVITLPQRYDFFLVSQCVRQGTVSPTSYNVIYDTIQFSPDKIQRLTYKLTHMYFNWSGTVRVPAPVQYAHKLAFLVGQSLHKAPNTVLEDYLYFL